jgi:hypothetical protein
MQLIGDGPQGGARDGLSGPQQPARLTEGAKLQG